MRRENLRAAILAQELNTNDFFVQLAQLGSQCIITAATTTNFSSRQLPVPEFLSYSHYIYS